MQSWMDSTSSDLSSSEHEEIAAHAGPVVPPRSAAHRRRSSAIALRMERKRSVGSVWPLPITVNDEGGGEDDDGEHPLIRVERVALQRRLSRRASIGLSGDALGAAQRLERKLSERINVLRRIASKQLVVVHSDVALDVRVESAKPASATLELIAILKRRVATRGSGDGNGHTLTSPRAATAAVRATKAERMEMNAILAAVKRRRRTAGANDGSVAMTCKRASEFVITAALRSILADCYFPFADERVSAAMCGVYFQKQAGRSTDEAKVTALLPLVKRIGAEKRTVLASLCVLLKSCAIAREPRADLIDQWGPSLLILSTRTGKVS